MGKRVAEDQLKRFDLVAPQDGKVFQQSVHTVGGVIQAGEAVMLIVPDGDSLIVEARIAPQEIDQVHMGQRTMLRFTAFNQRTTPELNGEVVPTTRCASVFPTANWRASGCKNLSPGRSLHADHSAHRDVLSREADAPDHESVHRTMTSGPPRQGRSASRSRGRLRRSAGLVRNAGRPCPAGWWRDAALATQCG